MIYTDPEIIKPETFRLLQHLQSDEVLDKFFLVGGTALALFLGHRLSIDLDFFSQSEFDVSKTEVLLQRNYGFNTTGKENNTLRGFIDDVKIDIITHDYPLIEPLIKVKGIRLASSIDIAAMKLNAIAGNGTRQKDFYDIFFLLEQFSLDQMLSAYEVKYPQSSPMIPLRGITYFSDIDFEYEPPELVRKVEFQEVEYRLKSAVVNSSKKF